MTKYGSAFSGTDARKQAPGEYHNAALRRYTNLFDLTVDGSTSEALKIADIGPGFVMHSILIDTDVDCSARTFAIGISGSTAKYSAAATAPNATQQVRYPKMSLGVTPSTAREEILLTPSGAIPATGSLRVTIIGSHI